MKSILKLMLVAVVMMFSASAFAECYITLSLCKPMGIRKATTFADSYDGSSKHPHRCLLRAREYLNYCKSNQQVGADFYVSGILTIGAYVTPTTSSLWTKSSGGHWIPVLTSY